ncbi:MAG: hypothetical protein SF051_15665 [Elusimicrobiota bacterium]|nr:hypothetical protein [Elusimicrobiota bacterium]
MKNLALAALAAALAVAACKKPLPPEPRPDYDGAKSHSDRAHGSLDKESAD